MNNYSLSIILILLFLIGCRQNSQQNTTTKVLKGATVFDGAGNQINNAILVIEDDKITYVGTDETRFPKNVEIMDITGKFITPGLVDAHIHFFQTGFFDARPDALDIRDSIPYHDVYQHQKNNATKYYESYLRSGVTAVYDVGDFGWTLSMAKDAENDSLAPHIASSGALLTPASNERIATFNTEDDTVMVHLGSAQIGENHVKNVIRKGATGIKIWGVSVNDSIFMKSLEATAKTVQDAENQLIVHATTLEQAKAALELGARLLVHSVEDTIVDDEFIELAKKNNTYYNPTLVVYEGYYNTYRAVLGDSFKINDPNNVVDERTKDLLKGAHSFQLFYGDSLAARQNLKNMKNRLAYRDSIMGINLRKVYEAGIPIVVGTDAGNPGTLHGISIYDEMEAMQKAGIPASDIIVMATKNGAEIMRRSDDFGTLQKGKLADLIILETDPSEDISNMRSITHVMRGGILKPVDSPF